MQNQFFIYDFLGGNIYAFEPKLWPKNLIPKGKFGYISYIPEISKKILPALFFFI